MAVTELADPVKVRKKVFQSCSSPVIELSRDDLDPGKVGELLRNGAKSVILMDDPRVGCIWKGFLGCQDAEGAIADKSSLPWDTSLLNVTRNHVPGNMRLGDMIRFVPGGYAHIARKMIVFPSDDGERMQSVPQCFWDGDCQVRFSQQTLRTAWDLMSDVLRSTLPADFQWPRYAVKVELLKYPNSSDELENMFGLLADAAGGWTRLGHVLDCNKSMCNNVLGTRLNRLNDCVAWGSLIPGLRSLIRLAVNSLAKRNGNAVPENTRLVGGPHVDGSKVINGLASERDTLKTEVYDGKHWWELPLTNDTLAIFPSQKIYKQLGIAPTTHRILMDRESRSHVDGKPNITLNIGIVDRPDSASLDCCN